MSGGVNPLEYLIPPVGITHQIVDTAVSAGAKSTGQSNPLPGTPYSERDRADTAKDKMERDRQRMLAQADLARTQAEDDLARRTETPQEALDAKRRAASSADRLGGGKRRASATLTEPGLPLGGSY